MTYASNKAQIHILSEHHYIAQCKFVMKRHDLELHFVVLCNHKAILQPIIYILFLKSSNLHLSLDLIGLSLGSTLKLSCLSLGLTSQFAGLSLQLLAVSNDGGLGLGGGVLCE